MGLCVARTFVVRNVIHCLYISSPCATCSPISCSDAFNACPVCVTAILRARAWSKAPEARRLRRNSAVVSEALRASSTRSRVVEVTKEHEACMLAWNHARMRLCVSDSLSSSTSSGSRALTPGGTATDLACTSSRRRSLAMG